MSQVEWEYKLEGLTSTGQWIETNHYGGYHSKIVIHGLLQNQLQRLKPTYRNFRIWKRPQRNWELVLNVAINDTDYTKGN